MGELLGAAREVWGAYGTPGRDEKDYIGVFEAPILGERVNGELGRRDPPEDFLGDLFSLGCFALGKASVRLKLGQVLGGRFVRGQCLRRATFSSFGAYWRLCRPVPLDAPPATTDGALAPSGSLPPSRS